MNTRVQIGMDGFEETGEFRHPLPGDFWFHNGRVYTGTLSGVGSRTIVVRKETVTSYAPNIVLDFSDVIKNEQTIEQMHANPIYDT